jgi:hypothetical protein
MKRLACALALGSAALVAHGHQDRLLTLADDGAVPGLPAEYAATRLKIEFDRMRPDRVVGIVLTVPGHETRVPPCLLQKILPSSKDRVVLKGSWYHDLSLMPPYVDVSIKADPPASKQSTEEGVELLFSLRDAKLISARRWVTTSGRYGPGSTSSPLKCDWIGQRPGSPIAAGRERQLRSSLPTRDGPGAGAELGHDKASSSTREEAAWALAGRLR